MNKHREVFKIIKRLEDLKEYIEPAMMTDLYHADEKDIDAMQSEIEKLFFVAEKIVYKRYLK